MSETAEAGPSSIPLYVSNGKAYCWDAQDVANLRVRHRICGLMTGTLPGVSQQNVFLGLPQLLMPEEVVLLVENRICHLIHSPSAIIPPTSSQIHAHEQSRLQTVQSLQEEAAAAAVEKARMFAGKVKDSVEVQRKREERRRQKEMARVKGKEREESLVDGWMGGCEVKVGVNEPTTSLPQEERDNGARDTASAPTREVVHGQTSSSHPPLHSKLSDGPAYFTTVPATPVDHPWFSPATTSSIYHDLEAARSANIWTYPTTLLERARCASFRKIWEEGMYAGHGVRFGGEFLIYPGDPLRYHSHFVNTTLPSPETVIRPMELVAWGRLGTATKKAHLICCYDENGGRDDKDEKVAGRGTVDCYSLEWGNFG